MTTADPITMEVVRNALNSIADEMALVIMRTAYSTIVRDSMDYSTGLCDRHGRVVAHGLTMALHLGSFPDAMTALMHSHGNDMRPGDMFVFNSRHEGRARAKESKSSHSAHNQTKPAIEEDKAPIPQSAVLVLDVATDQEGHVRVLLGQGGQPAQTFHVVSSPDGTPWFTVSQTPGISLGPRETLKLKNLRHWKG